MYSIKYVVTIPPAAVQIVRKLYIRWIKNEPES